MWGLSAYNSVVLPWRVEQVFSDRPTDVAVGRGSGLPPTPVLDVSETIPSPRRPAHLNEQNHA